MVNKSDILKCLDVDLAGYPEMGFLTSDMTHADAAVHALRKSLFKKFEDETSREADAKAVQKFLDANELCAQFTTDRATTTQECEVVEVVKQLLWEAFSPMAFNKGHCDPLKMGALGGVGPGASVGSESHNFYTKLFDSPLNGTSTKLHAWYKVVADHNSKTWWDAEMLRSARFGDGVVDGNILGTVPKNVDISRTIATEPPLNMFFQKGIGRSIEAQLFVDHYIDLSKQPELNRLMAQQGSISRKFATIDLASASDTISMTLLKWLMPMEFFSILQAARSPFCSVDGKKVSLNMVGTMGNGFTFPLQTYLFATVVKACYAVLGIKPVVGPCANYSVFGDDIIVLNDAYQFVSRMLHVFGFVVNHDKSFAHGDFRESCGGDYFHGLNIRGFYITSLKTRFNVNAAYNGLLLWQIRHGVTLPTVMRYFLDNTKKINNVPLWEDPSSGFYAAGSSIGESYQKMVKVPLRVKPELLSTVYQNYRENRDGWLTAVLGGYVRGGQITLRTNVPAFGYETVSLRVKPHLNGKGIKYFAKYVTLWRDRVLNARSRHRRAELLFSGDSVHSAPRDDLYRIQRVHTDACQEWFPMLDIVTQETESLVS